MWNRKKNYFYTLVGLALVFACCVLFFRNRTTNKLSSKLSSHAPIEQPANTDTLPDFSKEFLDANPFCSFTRMEPYSEDSNCGEKIYEDLYLRKVNTDCGGGVAILGGVCKKFSKTTPMLLTFEGTLVPLEISKDKTMHVKDSAGTDDVIYEYLSKSSKTDLKSETGPFVFIGNNLKEKLKSLKIEKPESTFDGKRCKNLNIKDAHSYNTFYSKLLGKTLYRASHEDRYNDQTCEASRGIVLNGNICKELKREEKTDCMNSEGFDDEPEYIIQINSKIWIYRSWTSAGEDTLEGLEPYSQ